jgi:hypothetical protein
MQFSQKEADNNDSIAWFSRYQKIPVAEIFKKKGWNVR